MNRTHTMDGKTWEEEKYSLVGSVPQVRSRTVSRPAKVGEYPVFVEQFGSFRTFTYSRKIKEIEDAGA